MIAHQPLGWPGREEENGGRRPTSKTHSTYANLGGCPVYPPPAPRGVEPASRPACLCGGRGKNVKKKHRVGPPEKKKLAQTSSPFFFFIHHPHLPSPPFIMKFAAFALAAFVAVAAAQVSQLGRKRAGGRGARRRRDLARALPFNSASFLGRPPPTLRALPAPSPLTTRRCAMYPAPGGRDLGLGVGGRPRGPRLCLNRGGRRARPPASRARFAPPFAHLAAIPRP